MQQNKSKSVAIVGMGASHRSYTGLAASLGGCHRLADQVWAINSMGGVIEHDLLFAMDDCRVQESRAKADPSGNIAGLVEWLKSHPNFVTSKVYDDYPGAVAFPLQEAIDTYGHPYFNNTVAYAFVYAMMQGFTSISLFGCDFGYADINKAERGRACLEFWVGIACARGISVQVAADSSLLDASCPLDIKLYGYDAYDLSLEHVEGKAAPQVVAKARDVLPSAEEIEQRYNYQGAA
ncbi:hypothetical protein [Zhongshania marina]|uniref:Uncharacterized protein n=1 Tax=Zhongshania marina TaxID=2304603 RepID=A0A2S4HGF3_9GAMM|nr:hypothetical protein [Marortus luteolus]POP53068.1 hypothetical protein C0068_08225 [Marortus luteolus]